MLLLGPVSAGLTCRVWAQKGVEPTEEEVKGKKLALTPLTALPEELILFQRVLQLFRGVRTSVFDAFESMAWLTECVAGWVQLCTSHSVSLNFIEHISPFAVRNFPRQDQII